jgi:hypothetical protein
MKQCALCNEDIDDSLIQFGDALKMHGEFWHAECYEEYFGEVLQKV